MSKLIINTKETELKTDSIKPSNGAPNAFDDKTEASDIASLNLPKSNEYKAFTIPKKINASHLFVVDGQECICLTETIPE